LNESVYAWLAISIYVCLGLGVAALAKRQLGGFVSAMSYAATTYSAFMMVGLAGLTYKMGVGALGFELTYLCGLVLVVFFGPRFWLVGRRYDYLTHAQLLADRYESRAVGIVAALLCLIFLIPYAAIQLMGIGYLVSVISKGAISLMTAMILATSIAIVWSNIAGLRSVAWTDALQALIMLITSIWVLFLVVDKGFGGFNAFFEQMEQQTPRLLAGAGLFKFNVFFGLALPWLFFPLSNPQVSQRLFVPKSVKAFKQMIGGFLIFGFIYTLVSIFWGFSARLLIPGLKEADLATPSLLALPVVPGIIVVIVMVGILSAAISTIDSILLSLSSMCARDIVKNGLHAGISEKTELIVGKLIIPVLAAVFLLFAFWAVGKSGFAFMIAPLSAAASAGLLMAVPAIIGAFFWKRATAAGALGSMIGGAATVLLLQLTGYKPLGMWPGVWGLAVCLILYVAISLLTVAPIRKAEDFIGYINQNLSKYKFV
jgi:SSS family solute:Na+ symporter